MNRKQKKVFIRIITASILTVVCLLLPFSGMLRLALFLLPYFVIGYDILKKALRGILRGKAFDENFLMAIATVGAILLGDYVEATAVMLFYQIGELFQNYAVGKSRKNIRDLMDIRPDHANIENENGDLIEVDPSEVAVGSVIVIKVGEKIPIDGVIIEGNTSLDTSALTGESLPREVFEGSEIYSGAINISNVIKIRTTKDFENSTVSKILDLVETAGANKSRSEKFISRFAKYYTPVVCIGALILATVPSLVSIILSVEPSFSEWIKRALTFLVISCPCALVISIPLSFFAGIGGASSSGILVKGSNHLETLAKAEYVVMDKTGTLTNGSFSIEEIFNNTVEKEKLIEYAALAEIYSTHPISQCLREACSIELDTSRVSDVRELSGLGVCAIVDGREVYVGNTKLMREIPVCHDDIKRVGTVVHVAIDRSFWGSILISDTPKSTAKAAILEMKRIGIRKTVMLTGDTEDIAAKISDELCIDEYCSDLLPSDKVSIVERLMSELDSKGMLVFVGDGINDAPVLARADVGISMGTLGSDCAIEASDIVIMDDDPMKVIKAIKIAKKCLKIVYQNIYFAIGVKFICLVLGALGFANMWLAIFADVGVMVIAILNAVRALNTKNL